ncbi:MAG: NTP transferase domain-containing protein [Planctomycetales bacterium]|nr:NTP transferase domain-containing protein [Planctomycetales bacterium]
MSTIGVVDLPALTSDSPRGMRTLPARRFAGASLLEWVSQRVTEVEAIDQTVVLLADPHRDLACLVPGNVTVHVSGAADPLARMAEVARARGANAIVRVSVDTPFVDPVLVDQLVCSAADSGCDYATYCSGGGRSAIQAQLGLVAEWIDGAALARANCETTQAVARSSPSRPIWSRPDLYRLRFIPLPKPLDRDDLRLVVTSEEDWEHAHQIVEALGPDDLDWQRIAVLLEEQPDIRQRMAALNNVQ